MIVYLDNKRDMFSLLQTYSSNQHMLAIMQTEDVRINLCAILTYHMTQGNRGNTSWWLTSKFQDVILIELCLGWSSGCINDKGT